MTGRAGKATGKNKYWYNIKEDLSEEKKNINLEQVDWELLNCVANVNLVQKNECRINEITEAKLTELENFVILIPRSAGLWPIYTVNKMGYYKQRWEDQG